MALKNTAPKGPLAVKLNLLTTTGAALVKSLPFGGAVGVVVAGAVLWLAPRLVPEGWSSEAVLSLGMGAGVVLHRLVDAWFGWFFAPLGRHLHARWDAAIQLAKLGRYQKRGLIPPEDAHDIAGRIVRADVQAKPRPKR